MARDIGIDPITRRAFYPITTHPLKGIKTMHPSKMTRIIDRKKYDTEKSTLIASNKYWDGSNFERSGRNCFLYRTANGAYFTVNLTQWQGERDTLTPITQEEAIDLFENALSEHEVKYAEAFPDVTVAEA